MSKSHQDVSVIVTVLNESETISNLLESLINQTIAPTRIVVVDGGSIDETVSIIKRYIQKFKAIEIVCKVQVGNRSIGRNLAIKYVETKLVACTDAGCIPEADWLEKLLAAYSKSGAPVIAGYYKGVFTNSFQRAVIPYALVMPDSVNSGNFLPATRSLLIEKNVWKDLGGFDEKLSDNEDYAFAKNLQRKNIPIAFAREAVVSWQPRKTLYEFYRMIFRFARGDIQAGIIRPKVLFIFFRYAVALQIIFLLLLNKSQTLLFLITILFVLYCGWAILKNIKYVGSAWYWLPILQITSDIGVILGSIAGAKIALQK